MVVNVQTLARLADKEVEQMAADFGALPLDIRESITRKMAEARQAVVDAAADQIVALLQAKDGFVAQTALGITNLEKQITDLKAGLEKIQLATQYGVATQNFLPLSMLIGSGNGGCNKKELLSVPAGWTPPAPAAAAAPAASA